MHKNASPARKKQEITKKKLHKSIVFYDENRFRSATDKITETPKYRILRYVGRFFRSARFSRFANCSYFAMLFYKKSQRWTGFFFRFACIFATVLAGFLESAVFSR